VVDVKSTLTETLAVHQPENAGFNCAGCDWEPVNPSVTGDEEFAAHQAHMVLSRLPEQMADRSNVAEALRQQPMWEHGGAWSTIKDGEVEFEADHQNLYGTIPIGAALGLIAVLAAAVVSEGETRDA